MAPSMNSLKLPPGPNFCLHAKPIGLLNVAKTNFAPLLALVQHAAQEGFIQPKYTHLLLSYENPTELLEALITYTPPHDQFTWTDQPPER